MKKLILFLCLGSLASCMSFSDKPLRGVRNSITQQMPEIRLDKEFAVSIGGGLFNFLDVITFNEADVSEMDHVQVAVYKVDSGRRDIDFSKLNFEQTMLAKDSNLHWETIVRVRDDEEQVWVLAGMNLDRNSLDAVTVFVLDKDELVLINVDGDLHEMLDFALEPAVRHRGEIKVL